MGTAYIWLLVIIIALLFLITKNSYEAVAIILGAVSANSVAWRGLGFKLQLLVFLVIAIMVILIVNYKYRSSSYSKIAAVSPLIGLTVLITEDINNNLRTGKVTDGENTWTAINNGMKVLAVGESVNVIGIIDDILIVE